LVEITEVRIYKTKGNGAVKAYASVSLDNEFVVKGIRIVDSGKGLYVSMPSRKMKDGSYQDIFHPMNKAAREKIVKAVLKAYNEKM